MKNETKRLPIGCRARYPLRSVVVAVVDLPRVGGGVVVGAEMKTIKVTLHCGFTEMLMYFISARKSGFKIISIKRIPHPAEYTLEMIPPEKQLDDENGYRSVRPSRKSPGEK